MYQKAMMLGVPASFVELRHEATHRDLPSLVVLRNAAQRSLDWLWEFYWAKLDHDQYEVNWSEGQLGDEERDADVDVDVDIDGLKKKEILNILQPVASEKKRILKLAASSKKRKAASSSEHVAAEMSYCLKGVMLFCSRERLGSLAVARVLLDAGEEVMIPRVKM